MMSSVWQVHPGTQPGQKVVMKGKGIMKGMQVDIIWRNLLLLKRTFLGKYIWNSVVNSAL